MLRAAAPYARLLLAIAAGAVLVGLVLRLALVGAWLPAGAWLWPGLPILVAGLVQDLAAWACLLAVPAALLACAPGLRPGVTTVRVLLGAALAGLCFGGAVEWYFFDEFNARFNHIAVDYILYPHEVVTSIREGYPVWPWVGGCLLAGAAIAWKPARWIADAAPDGRTWRARLAAVGLWLATGAVGALWLAYAPALHGRDRRSTEIAANGVASLVRAAWSAHLFYRDYYAAPPPSAEATAAAERAKGPAGTAPAVPGISQIVVVLEESFGSEFVGTLGGANACTPEFDRWSQRGLLFTNLIANGNRTVRGLEGVLASFPPVPPDSVVKRSGIAGMPTIASACAQQGFASEFIYGGFASFDHMAPWLLANGWGQIQDDGFIAGSHFPATAFRTAWGVDDATLLDAVLARQIAAKQAGERLCLTALTVSNHKPFLVPPPFGKPKPLSTATILRYLLVGACAALALAGLWWQARGALGIPLLAGLTLLVAAGGAVFLVLKATPSDERRTAVAFADHAIGSYLDGLERAGLLECSLVLIVGDHGARVYGAQEIPFPSYRIPALVLAPGLRGERLDRLCSQVDLAPTLLGLAGIPAPAAWFGRNQRGLPARGGRAFLQHNRDIALLDDEACVILGLQRTVGTYARSGDRLERTASDAGGFPTRITAAEAVFAEAADRIEAYRR